MPSAMGARLPAVLAVLVAIAHSCKSVAAFSSAETSSSSFRSFAPESTLSMAASESPVSPLSKLKLPGNPFGSDEAPLVPQPPGTPPEPLGDDSEAIFMRARAVISSDLGVRDGSLLADNFVWIGPNVAETGPLGKKEYLAAGKFFDLRSAFPDLDYRAHDFRLDEKDPLTVRVTARMVGTMRGELRLRTETMPPNGKRLSCPPEAISITFDKFSGKVVKLCSGFTMDRLVGNTAGLCGVKAAATLAGAPPSEWEIYPPTVVLRRLVGRSIKQLEEPTSFLAPYPETVMIQLAKGVIAADNGASDPDLLAPSFTFCGPVVGPLGKKEFVESFGSFKLKDAFPDLETEFSNFRVDPYDPYRVWVDGRGSGTWTGPLLGKEGNGARYEGPPEAISFTFDDNGFCTRLTAGAVMDPTIGNTGGLGGVFGILYATGQSLPGLSTRPLPELIARLQKRITQPITGATVDDFSSTAVAPRKAPPVVKAATPVAPITPPKPPKIPAVQKLAPPKVDVDLDVAKSQKEAQAKKAEEARKQAAAKKAAEMAVAAKKKAEPAPVPAPKAAPAKPVPKIDVSDPVTEAFNSFFGTGSKKPAPKKAAAVAEQKKREAEEKRAAATAAAEAKQAAIAAAAEQKKREAERKRMALEEAKRAAAVKAKQAEQKKREALEAKKAAAAKAKQARELVEKAKPGVSISLFGLGQSDKDAEAKKAAAAKAKQARELVEKAKPGVSINLFGLGQSDKDAEAKRVAAANAKKAQELVAKAKPGASINLFGLGQSDKDAEAKKVAAADAKKAKELVAKAKPGASINLFAFGLKEKKEEPADKAKAAETKRADAEQKKREAEEKRAAAAAAAEARKAAAQAAAEQKKREAEEKRAAAAAAAEAKKAAAQAAAEQKKREAEEKRAAVTAAAEAKKAALEEKKREADEKRKALEAKKAAAANAKKAEEVVAKAKPGASIGLFFGQTEDDTAAKAKKAEETVAKAKPRSTISLFGFGGQTDDSASERVEAPTPKKAPAPVAPKGVPSLVDWRRNFDGSISGSISGSKAFKVGDKITTSPIKTGVVKSGNVVETQSGSKYFLV